MFYIDVKAFYYTKNNQFLAEIRPILPEFGFGPYIPRSPGRSRFFLHMALVYLNKYETGLSLPRRVFSYSRWAVLNPRELWYICES